VNVIKWERYMGSGGGHVGYVFGVPLYRLWCKRHGSWGTAWGLGVWIEAEHNWHWIANGLCDNPVSYLKAFADQHFAERLRPHLESLLRSIEVQPEPEPQRDPEPIILKFPTRTHPCLTSTLTEPLP
jgi:hypothetical protein